MGHNARWTHLSTIALLVLAPVFAAGCGGSGDGTEDERQPLISSSKGSAPADAGNQKDLEAEDGGAPPSSTGDPYLGGSGGGSSNTDSCDVTNLKYVKEAWDVLNSKTPELCNDGCSPGKCCYAESAAAVCVAK